MYLILNDHQCFSIYCTFHKISVEPMFMKKIILLSALIVIAGCKTSIKPFYITLDTPELHQKLKLLGKE